MRMADFRHAALQFPALPLTGEIDRRPDPDAFGDPKGLFDDPVEQRLDFAEPLAETRDRVRRHAFRHEQRGRGDFYPLFARGIPMDKEAVNAPPPQSPPA